VLNESWFIGDRAFVIIATITAAAIAAAAVLAVLRAAAVVLNTKGFCCWSSAVLYSSDQTAADLQRSQH
jgi:hypothetical protein